MMELDGQPIDASGIAALALFNYGHFTSMRVEDGRVKGLSLHLRRLASDCRSLFGTELDTDGVRGLVRRVCDDGAVTTRVTVFAPGMDLGRPGQSLEPHILVSTRPASVGDLPPLRLQSVRYERELPSVKHVGLFGTVLRRRAAQLAGFDDTLFVDHHGHISEGATWNIGFADDDGVVWPAADCLPGVTMQLLRSSNPHQRTMSIDLKRAGHMRAAFVTNAAIGVRPVASIDNVTYELNEGTVTALQAAYAEIQAETL